MGCVREAVLEFDEEVRAPWRPRLVAGYVVDGPSVPVAPRPPSRRSPSRVGVCRPPAPVRPVALPRAVPTGRGDARRPSGPRPGPAGRSAGPVSGARSPSGGLRLTRRARRLAVGIALCGGVVLGSWLAPLLAGGADDALHLAGVSSVVVEQGDTLWSIAASVADGEDVRGVVHRIQDLNGLEGAELVPGQVLRLP